MKSNRPNKYHFNGFTLVEVLVSMSLMAIITFVSLLVFSNVNNQSTSIEYQQLTEAADGFLNETISKKLFFNDKLEIPGHYIHKQFFIVPSSNNLGRLEISVIDEKQQTKYFIDHYVQLEK